MDFDLSWEVKLFSFFENVWGRWKASNATGPDQAAGVSFDEVETRLIFLARALCAFNIQLKTGADAGGVHGDLFILPKKMLICDQPALNRKAWIYRIWFMSAVWKHHNFLSGSESELEGFVTCCLAIREHLKTLKTASRQSFDEMRDFIQQEWAYRHPPQELASQRLEQLLRWAVFEPATEWEVELGTQESQTISNIVSLLEIQPHRFNGKIPSPLMLFGRLMTVGASLNAAPSQEAESPPSATEFPEGTEHEAPAMDEVQRARFSKKDQEDAVLLHTFEKVECLDDYNGLARDFDGSDEMDEHLDAMQELKLRHVIRSQEQTHSIYRADLRLHTAVGDLEDSSQQGIPYPEWDGKLRAYKPAWCQVFPSLAVGASDNGWQQRVIQQQRQTIQRLRQQLEPLRSTRRFVNRQRDGERIDIDTLVDNCSLLHARQTPSERVYLQKKKQNRNIATLILIDLSLSADSYVQGRKILEVCKESLVVLGHVLERLDDRVEVAGFYSSTRKSCHYLTLKKPEEPWTVLPQRLGTLESQGYTRIGPALRHATHRIQQMQSRKKLILLMSDGKPNDYDRYEGLYGIQDIRQAIREAKRLDIQIFALAISHQAYDYLPAMLGHRQFAVVKQPEDLPQSLGHVYQQLFR